MRIKTSLTVLSASFIAMMLMVAVIILYASSFLSGEFRKERAVNEVLKSTIELNVLTSEYLMHPGQRVREQWEQKYGSLGEILELMKKEEAHGPGLEALEAISLDYRALGGQFSRMLAAVAESEKLISESRTQSQLDLSFELRESLATQALMSTLRITSGILALHGMAERRIELVQKKARSVLIFSTIGFSVFAAAVSLATGRAIIKPIGELIRGAEIIGEGDLGHRITLKAGGEVGELALAFNQMTEKRGKAEEEIRKLNEDLERKVLERTAQLDAANKELEAFAYSVSHDLRAPLRSLDGFSQAVLEDYAESLDAQGQDYLGRIRAASQKMASLIDDILTLSRITRSEMRFEDVDLSAVARGIADGLKAEDPGREAEFVIQDGVSARGDERLLRIAMENLLRNAWKFTGKTSKAVIEFGAAPQGDSTAYFVRDNGAGFDMAYAEKLFAPFHRLHTSEDFSGTGIGLATVKRVIRRHGGEVWAEGAPGRGAAFYFTLKAGGGKQ